MNFLKVNITFFKKNSLKDIEDVINYRLNFLNKACKYL